MHAESPPGCGLLPLGSSSPTGQSTQWTTKDLVHRSLFCPNMYHQRRKKSVDEKSEETRASATCSVRGACILAQVRPDSRMTSRLRDQRLSQGLVVLCTYTGPLTACLLHHAVMVKAPQLRQSMRRAPNRGPARISAALSTPGTGSSPLTGTRRYWLEASEAAGSPRELHAWFGSHRAPLMSVQPGAQGPHVHCHLHSSLEGLCRLKRRRRRGIEPFPR